MCYCWKSLSLLTLGFCCSDYTPLLVYPAWYLHNLKHILMGAQFIDFIPYPQHSLWGGGSILKIPHKGVLVLCAVHLCVFSLCCSLCMYYGHTNDVCIISLVLANIHNGSRCIIDCLFSYWHFGNSIVVTAMRCQKNVTIFYSGFLCLCAQKIVFCLVFLNFWCNLLPLNNFHHVIIYS